MKMNSSILWHTLSIEDVCKELVVTKDGLDSNEAQSRLLKFGPNVLAKPPPVTLLMKIWTQLYTPLVIMLLIAAIVSAALDEWAEFGLIIGVVTLNTFIGILQEGKAEAAAEALANMLSSSALVIRNNENVTIPASDVVVGDVVMIQSGDRIPADLVLFDINNLQVQEAMLTGESLPVSKNSRIVSATASIGDRKNCGYSGTLVVRGQAYGIVVGTGMNTEIGKIANLVNNQEKVQTNLSRMLDRFAIVLSFACLTIGISSLLIAHFARNIPLGDSFRSAVAITVAIIPEGLAAVLTILLSVGMKEMASQNAIIRALPAVEALGAVTVICSDKTGTLTKNEMTAVAVATSTGSCFQLTGTGYNDEGELFVESEDGVSTMKPSEEENASIQHLLMVGVLCSDSTLLPPKTISEKNWTISGDPTELAILAGALKAKVPPSSSLKTQYPRVGLVPFESEHKFMGSMHPILSTSFNTTTNTTTPEASTPNTFELVVKGAPDRLFPLCLEAKQDPDYLHKWQSIAARYSSKGLRCIAVLSAQIVLEPDTANLDAFRASLSSASVLNGTYPFHLLGLVAIMDPPRDEAITAVQVAHRAGIVVKMITGDHPGTAVAIGKKLGIVTDDPLLVTKLVGSSERVCTGPELDAMEEAQLVQVVQNCNVFARASPENKIRIVKALQRRGELCVMTGDGVNDAPALRAADVGVAMGITGTDVSKEAAKMVLADDNFASIVSAVRQGRRVFDSLRKILAYNLPANLSQGMGVFFGFIVGLKQQPLTNIQILYVNLIVATTLGTALAFEPAEPDCMDRKPRSRRKGLWGKQVIWRCLFVTALIVTAKLLIFNWRMNSGASVAAARAETFTILILCSITYSLNTRYLRQSSLHPRILKGNPVFLPAIIVVLVLQVLLIYVPGLQDFMGCPDGLDGAGWGRAIGISVALFFVVEAEKMLAPRFIMPWMGPIIKKVEDFIINLPWMRQDVFLDSEDSLSTPCVANGIKASETENSLAKGSVSNGDVVVDISSTDPK